MTITVGVSGAGKVFERFYLPALSNNDDLLLTAICDPEPRRRAWAEKAAPGISSFSDFQAMIRHQSLDAVVLTSPPIHHIPQAIEAYRSGAHVLIEKPPSLTIESAMELIDTSKDRKRIIWAAFNRRYFRPYVQLGNHLHRTESPDLPRMQFRLHFVSDILVARDHAQTQNVSATDVISDVVTHQVDLVEHMFKTDINSIELTDFEGGLNSPSFIRYVIELQNGLVIDCEAAHKNLYVEELVAISGDQVLLASGSNFVASSTMGLQDLRRYLRLKQRLGSLWKRIRRRPNSMQESFEIQLGLFGDSLTRRSQVATSHGVQTILSNARALDACQQSLELMRAGLNSNSLLR